MTDPAPSSPTGIRRGNAVFAGLSASSAVLLLLLQALISKALGTAVFGRFNWALTLAMLGEALMDFGVHQITIRSIARDRSQTARLFHNSLALKTVSGAVMFVLMGGLSFVLADDRELWHASLAMLGVAVFRSYLLTIRGVLQGLERFGLDCLAVVADRVLVLVITGAAVWMGADLTGVVLAFAAARVVAVALALSFTRAHTAGVRFSFDVALWRDLQRQALPIGLFLVVLNVYNYIDTVMLGVMSTFTDTGLYSSAYRIYEGLSYAPAVFSALLLPRLSNLWKVNPAAHRRLATKSLAGATSLAVLSIAVVWPLSGVVLVFVFGPEASESVTALHVLLGGLVPVFGIWILHAVALSVFRERLLLHTTVVGALINAALNLWLIPQDGRDGAAMATVAGEVLTLALLAIGLRRELWPGTVVHA